MKRCTLDKIGSVTLRLGLDRRVVLGAQIPAVAGSVVAARVLNSKTRYNTLEDVHGRMVPLFPGDVIAGALGHRDALQGYAGEVPSSVAPGDEIQLLNLGGVLGVGARATPTLGEPFRLEVLGSVLTFPRVGERVGVAANVASAALPVPPVAELPTGPLPPVVALVGTSMNSGKTTACCALIGALRARGLRVAAGKLTGVSLRRDVLEMADCGADPVALFTDFGVVTTNESNAPATARALVAHLVHAQTVPPDIVVLEFGDGLLGTYGVHALLEDPVVRASITTTILCSYDPVGTWGGVKLLQDRYGLSVDAVSGPVTDGPTGVRFCTETLGIPAWNALACDPSIVDLVVRDEHASKALAEVST